MRNGGAEEVPTLPDHRGQPQHRLRTCSTYCGALIGMYAQARTDGWTAPAPMTHQRSAETGPGGASRNQHIQEVESGKRRAKRSLAVSARDTGSDLLPWRCGSQSTALLLGVALVESPSCLARRSHAHDQIIHRQKGDAGQPCYAAPDSLPSSPLLL